MILREMAMQIKHLREGGVPKARIARRLGVVRQTATNPLNREEVFHKRSWRTAPHEYAGRNVS